MPEILITKPSYLAAASLVVSKEKTRPYLGGVHIEKAPQGGIYLVATDGYRMVVFLDKNGETDDNYILPVSKTLFSQTKFSTDKYKQNPRLTINKDNPIVNVVYFTDNKYMETFEPIINNYPSWRKVVPDSCYINTKSKNSIEYENCYSATYLGVFSKIKITAFGKKSSRSSDLIYITRPEGSSSALITDNDPNWFGVLMTMRGLGLKGQKIPFDITLPGSLKSTNKIKE